MHEVILPKTSKKKKTQKTQSVLMCPQESCKICVTLILQKIVHLACAKDLKSGAVFSWDSTFFLNHLLPIYPTLTLRGASPYAESYSHWSVGNLNPWREPGPPPLPAAPFLSFYGSRGLCSEEVRQYVVRKQRTVSRTYLLWPVAEFTKTRHFTLAYETGNCLGNEEFFQ